MNMNKLDELIAGLRRNIVDNDGATDWATLEIADLELLLDAAEAVSRTETCLRCERQGAKGRLLEVIDRALYSLTVKEGYDATD